MISSIESSYEQAHMYVTVSSCISTSATFIHLNIQVAPRGDTCMCAVYEQEAKDENPVALFSPPSVGRVQAKLQLADARH